MTTKTLEEIVNAIIAKNVEALRKNAVNYKKDNFDYTKADTKMKVIDYKTKIERLEKLNTIYEKHIISLYQKVENLEQSLSELNFKTDILFNKVFRKK